MTKSLTISLLFISFSIFSQSRYELSDEGKEKFYLADTISSLAKIGKITNEPIVVVDGIPHRFQDLKNEKLALSKIEIAKIIPIDKQKGIGLYGSFGEAGVLIVTTNRTSAQKPIQEIKQ